jgi:phosphinothricin acetyltransferase
MAVIGDGSNMASIKLHEKLGFTHVGVVAAYGWKFDQWLDLVLMERVLGLGSQQPPD